MYGQRTQPKRMLLFKEKSIAIKEHTAHANFLQFHCRPLSFIQSSTDGHVGWSCILPIVRNTAVNTGVHRSF